MWFFGLLVAGVCFVATLFFVLTADVAPIWKILAVLIYALSWFIDRWLQLGVSIGFFNQIALCLCYLIYFKFESA